jgi:hypothetical protein
MLGTLKLKDVGLQPDATQATQLVTLWQAYQSVASSDSAVAAEAEAVLKEIRATMTPEQLASIAAMALTQEDLQGFVDEFRQTASPSGGTSRSAMTPGQGPGGGPGPGFTGIVGGEGFAGEGSVPPEPMATVQPGSVGNGSDASGTGLLLIQPLIAELQELAGT